MDDWVSAEQAAVPERFDPTWDYGFKWIYDAKRNKAHVWRIPTGSDGSDTHRAEAGVLLGRPLKVTEKDALGLAQYIPAEKKLDGKLVAPPHVLVEAFYGTEIPDSVHRELAKMFPDAVVRNARVSSVTNPNTPKPKSPNTQKETDTFEEPEKDVDDPELKSDFSTDPKYHLRPPNIQSAVWASQQFKLPEQGKHPKKWSRALSGLLRRPQGASEADHEGAMIAIYLPEDVGKQIEVKGGEPIEDMHITLAYFVDKAADRDDWDELAKIVESFSNKHGKLTGKIGGYGVFHNDVDVLWASADLPGVNELRHEIVEAAEDAGFMVSKDHSFTPHITLKYDHKGKLPKRDPIDVTFDELCLTTGGEKLAFDLTGKGFEKNL